MVRICLILEKPQAGGGGFWFQSRSDLVTVAV
jgi:hypothetical protein